MDYNKIKHEFDSLPPDVQWYWVLVDEKHLISDIVLLENHTFIYLDGDIEGKFKLSAKAHIGNTEGVLYAIRAFGITATKIDNNHE